MDVLSDILSTLRLQGTVYFQADFHAPWGMDMKDSEHACFHFVVRGRCWLKGPNSDKPIELNAGDVAVLTQGDRHALLHSPEATPIPAEHLIEQISTQSTASELTDTDHSTTLICGHYAFDKAGFHPLLQALPRLLLLNGSHKSVWLTSVSELSVLESRSNQSGSSAVVDRLAEILLIQVIRAHMERLTEPQGFLAALAEPAIATALSVLHEMPEKSWQLTELARLCGVSRTVLVDRFKLFLGVSPMSYLRQVRMYKARNLLIVGQDSIANVATLVGYTSEWSFSKAYKRTFGEGPGATRKTHSVA